MKKQMESSDDVLFLEGLSIDWSYLPGNPLGKRAYVRLGEGDLTALFEVRSIKVRLTNAKFKMNASLLDVSPGGLAVLIDKKLIMDSSVEVSFYLSRRKIISSCVVRQVYPLYTNFKIGLEFINLPKEDSEYIANLYSSKVLYKVGDQKG